MSKDPAFLFYYQDFFTGISDMSNEEAGAYIRCLCIQASKGGITEKHMKNICNSNEVHEEIKSKFVLNEETKLLENKRLKEEIEKRHKYSQSRSNNRKGKKKEPTDINNTSKTYVPHMENEIENEIENIIVDEVKNKKEQKNNFFLNELLISEEWIERVSMNSKEKYLPDQTKEMLKKFNEGLNLKFDYKINKSDYTTHFVNWLDTQPKNQNKNGTGQTRNRNRD